MGIYETSCLKVHQPFVLILFILVLSSMKGDSQPLVPAMFIFGDSVVDVGNNDYLETVVKSNFPPYGRDFINHHATGRFCNGKLASDFTGENLGFTSYPPPILSKEAKGKNLLLGANFASGGSGYYDTTAKLYNTIPLTKQLGYYKEYQKKLVEVAGQSNATSIIKGSIYLISSGSSDFVQNYYVNPLLYKVYTPHQFADILIQAYSHFIQNTIPLTKQLGYYKEYQKKLVEVAGQSNATSIIKGSIYLISSGSSDFVQNYYVNPLLYKVYTPHQFADILIQAYSHFIQELYQLGARKIGVSTLPPIGCLPASITLFGEDSNECVAKMNSVAEYFNKMLNATSLSLKSKLLGLNLVVLDIYHPLLDLIQKPTDYGFFEARKACCGTGLVETSFLCNKESPGTCKNASAYVFWDGFHPSEAANKILADDLLVDGISLVS